jgi:hypothetical protein
MRGSHLCGALFEMWFGGWVTIISAYGMAVDTPDIQHHTSADCRFDGHSGQLDWGTHKGSK